jgi:hypothetical protein
MEHLIAHYHNLHASGLGREIKHARVLSEDDKEKMWRSGVLGTSSPQALQNAVFYTVGKVQYSSIQSTWWSGNAVFVYLSNQTVSGSR